MTIDTTRVRCPSQLIKMFFFRSNRNNEEKASIKDFEQQISNMQLKINITRKNKHQLLFIFCVLLPKVKHIQNCCANCKPTNTSLSGRCRIWQIFVAGLDSFRFMLTNQNVVQAFSSTYEKLTMADDMWRRQPSLVYSTSYGC